jgi:hypothetical protein
MCRSVCVQAKAGAEPTAAMMAATMKARACRDSTLTFNINATMNRPDVPPAAHYFIFVHEPNAAEKSATPPGAGAFTIDRYNAPTAHAFAIVSHYQ